MNRKSSRFCHSSLETFCFILRLSIPFKANLGYSIQFALHINCSPDLRSNSESHSPMILSRFLEGIVEGECGVITPYLGICPISTPSAVDL